MALKKLKIGKGKTEGRKIAIGNREGEEWSKKYYELEIDLPDNCQEETLQASRVQAEQMIDGWLNEPEVANIPDLDLGEVKELPWRTYEKGSAPGSAKPDEPGWIFANDETPPTADLVKAIGKVGTLTLGEWTLKFSGRDRTLISRSRPKKEK